ncbi:MAG: bifunctional methylenetetrahydrofolate dehydrogenase/methenyltetrahydrofolate cyclohydrolase [Gammaproteobacteria bacterium]|nr:bifunctional methylenetetrahydrofolate dehydrogenase/methenyltetrahydrofolate cyclohydrolase [Gammaproteobacteria bacterium]
MAVAKLIDGKIKAKKITDFVKRKSVKLREKYGIRPGLAVVVIGEDPASHIYVRNKKRTAESCGFYSRQYTLPENTSEIEVLKLIDDLNGDNVIHGILVQLPLPKHLDEIVITQAISPFKDVDGFHYRNIGKLTSGDTSNAFIPCTPAGCMILIEDEFSNDLSGMNAIVIGRSNIVGRPMASLLLKAHATVTIAHSRTKNLSLLASNADIIIVAVGIPNIVKTNWIKPGATIIDVGINRIGKVIDGKIKMGLTGDVDFDEACSVARAITPVPGGVGPMTIAMLMSNTLLAARLSKKLDENSLN